MSIYQAIANPRIPNIAQATMMGEQGRLQEQQAGMAQEAHELNQRIGEQNLEKVGLEIEALRNQPTDLNAQLEQLSARNEIMYNTLSGVTDEATYQAALPTLRRVDPEAPAQYDPTYVRESMGNAARWRENQTDIAKAFADAEAARLRGDNQAAEAIIERALRQPQQNQPNLQSRSGIVHGEESISQIMTDPITGRSFREMNGERQYLAATDWTPVNASVTGSREDVLPPSRSDTLQGQLDWADFGVSEIDRMLGKIQADPTIVGPVGTGRRWIRTWSGVADDLVTVFGQAGATDAQAMIQNAQSAALEDLNDGNMDPEVYASLFGNPDLEEVPLFENALTYMLARTWQPEDRLMAQTITQARSSARITGFQSSEQVVNRLNYVRRQMDTRRTSLRRRLGEQANIRRWNPETRTLEGGDGG